MACHICGTNIFDNVLISQFFVIRKLVSAIVKHLTSVLFENFILIFFPQEEDSRDSSILCYDFYQKIASNSLQNQSSLRGGKT